HANSDGKRSLLAPELFRAAEVVEGAADRGQLPAFGGALIDQALVGRAIALHDGGIELRGHPFGSFDSRDCIDAILPFLNWPTPSLGIGCPARKRQQNEGRYCNAKSLHRDLLCSKKTEQKSEAGGTIRLLFLFQAAEEAIGRTIQGVIVDGEDSLVAVA